jgi:hypothetical protein
VKTNTVLKEKLNIPAENILQCEEYENGYIYIAEL